LGGEPEESLDCKGEEMGASQSKFFWNQARMRSRSWNFSSEEENYKGYYGVNVAKGSRDHSHMPSKIMRPPHLQGLLPSVCSTTGDKIIALFDLGAWLGRDRVERTPRRY
jgi:hypothetical protein